MNFSIPTELIDARDAKRLVVFAGAGVSIPKPTDIPGSDDLKRQFSSHLSLRGLRGPDYSPEGKALEEYLTDIELLGVKVHHLLRWILTTPQRKPNQLHFHILRLFKDQSSVKLVTTNYDDMFEEAMKTIYPPHESDDVVPVTVYPDATPLPFRGIIHLCGAISRVDVDMKISRLEHEAEFKRLDWPTCAIDALFRENVILFVGYSHRDSIFNNYAQIIASDSRYTQHALIKNGEEQYWDGFNVNLIQYDDYTQLPTILKTWANRI